MRPARSTSAPLASASMPASGRGLHAGGPDLRARRDSRSVLVRRASTTTPVSSMSVTMLACAARRRGARAPAPPCRTAGRRRRPAAPCRRRRAGSRRCAGSIARKSSLSTAPRQLGDLAGELHAGRPAADDDEGQPLAVALRDRRLELGHLEGAEDPPAQLEGVVDRLHARCAARELVVTEVGLAGAGGDDQAVVRDLDRAVRRDAWPCTLRRSRSKPVTSASSTSTLRVPPQDVAERRRDLALATGSRSPPGRAAAGRGGGCGGRPASPRPGRAAGLRAANSPPKPPPTITTRWDSEAIVSR